MIVLLLTAVCLFLALRQKKPIFLAIPFLGIFVYFLVQIILVPAPFLDTIKFIFSLS
jgi:hypothetical protein